MKDFIFFSFGAYLGSLLYLIWRSFPEKSLFNLELNCEHCNSHLIKRRFISVIFYRPLSLLCPFCQQKPRIVPWLMESICACFMLLANQGYLSAIQVITLLCGLLLSSYDWRDQSFPFILWLLFFLLSSSLKPWNLMTVCCLAIACVSQFKHMGIGAGDFLFMASLSLIFSYPELLLITQLSSLTGICYIFLRREKQSIPFLPFLYLASLFLISFSLTK